MMHLQALEELRLEGAFVTIGSFDGVHLGHQRILGDMVQAARAANAPSAVVTFHPHPAVVLRGLPPAYSLTSPQERARLFGQLGLDAIYTLTFDRALAALSAREFVARLCDYLGMRELWVGYDFALGRGREGNIPFLEQLGRELGYTLKVFAPINQDGRAVSSSQVRGLLGEGDVRQAAALLGRPFAFEGPVVHGDGRGRTIGIPTANVQTWEGQLLPRNGVYATACWVDGARHPAVTNVGMRPTFPNTPPVPRVEALLLDGDQDLYGKTARLEFIEFLRPEQRFENVQALLDQIQIDRRRALAVLDQEP